MRPFHIRRYPPIARVSIVHASSRRRYAYFKKLDYFSTECVYSPDAYRGHARTFLKDLEKERSSAIIDIIHSGEAFEVNEGVKAKAKIQRTVPFACDYCAPTPNTKPYPILGTCSRCGYISSNELCKACLLLEGLERGLPNLAIVSEVKRTHTEN